MFCVSDVISEQKNETRTEKIDFRRVEVELKVELFFELEMNLNWNYFPQTEVEVDVKIFLNLNFYNDVTAWDSLWKCTSFWSQTMHCEWADLQTVRLTVQ